MLLGASSRLRLATEEEMAGDFPEFEVGALPPLDASVAYRKELTLRWSNSYSTWQGRSEYDLALDLLAAGRIAAEPLLTHHFPLEQIADAFAAADDKRGSGAIKVLVHP